MNQQPSSSVATIISSTRSNKRSRGGSTDPAISSSSSSTSPNPTITTADHPSSRHGKCTSVVNDMSLDSEIITTTATTTTTAHNGSSAASSNKRPRSRSGSSHPHPFVTNPTAAAAETETNENDDKGEHKHHNDGIERSTRNTTTSHQTSQERIMSQKMTEDYVELASHMMLHPLSQIRAANLIASGGPITTTTTTTTTHASRETNGSSQGDGNHSTTGSTTTLRPMVAAMTTTPQSQYLVHISALGYLKSPMRRPTVIETWSPYEIAMFEASIAEHGKNFARIQQEIRTTKTVPEVIEFYYIWKKTSHYAQWKKEYVPEYLDVDVDE